jgi:hypothetical protein
MSAFHPDCAIPDSQQTTQKRTPASAMALADDQHSDPSSQKDRDRQPVSSAPVSNQLGSVLGQKDGGDRGAITANITATPFQ